MITALTEYQQLTTGYAHQEQDYLRSRNMRHFALFWEMGTGKSKTVIDTAGHLYCRQEIDGVLLVSDKGAYLNMIPEFEKHLHPMVPRRIAYWSSQMGRQEEAEVSKLHRAQDNMLDILLLNVEALSSERARQFAARFILSHYCLMIVDEATSIKNPKAERTKVATHLGKSCEYRRIMTGTPVTQGPLDLYSMCDFLYSGLLGFTSFTAFRACYAQMIMMVMGTRTFPKITGYRRLDELTKSLEPFSSRRLKSECLDLPDKLYEVRHVELTHQQRQAYDDLKQTAVVQLLQGLLTSTSALTTVNKLQQICCGHVSLDDKTRVNIESNRVLELLRIIEEIGHKKVIIWCAFQRDVELIIEALEKLPMPHYPVTYYGKTKDADRLCAIDSFINDSNCLWFVGTAATGGKSLTLTVASHVIYYSNSYSLEDRLQSEDRAHRIGQGKNVTYIDLVARGTVDERVLKSLKMKEDLSHEILDKLRDLI